jgi:uncharacterized membrane protein YphA (DoxX/SURF4 family)
MSELFMRKIGFFLLNIAVSLYLFVNGILGFTNANESEFSTIVRTIFPRGWDFNNALVIVLSVIAIIAGVLLLVAVFKNDVAIINVILYIFIVLWVIFIVIVDIISPVSYGISVPLDFLKQLSTHCMVLGAIIMSTRRFGRMIVSVH